MKRHLFVYLSASLLLVAASVVLPAQARAATDPPTEVEGVIVKVADGEIIVDLGHAEGLGDDARVRVFRRVEVTHPVTGKTVVDRFPIGRMRLDQVGKRLSIATDAESLQRLPSVGDFAVYAPQKSASTSPTSSGSTSSGSTPSGTTPSGSTSSGTTKTAADQADRIDSPADGASPADCDCQTPAPADPAMAAVNSAFEHTLGRSLSERIDIWSRFLQQHPKTPYAADIDDELAWLRQRRDAVRQAQGEPVRPSDRSPTGADLAAAAAKSAPTVQPLAGSVNIAETVEVGQALDIVATIDEPRRVQQVRLLTRRAADPAYQEHLMERAGDHNWRVQLDQAADQAGNIDYFVEVVRDDDQLQTISGTAEQPRILAVARPEATPPERDNRSKATALFDYVNFKSGEGKDEYLRFESDYRYWVGAGIFEAFKVGVGIFDGSGGTVEAIEAGRDARDISVSYGFAEMQFGFGDFVGLSGRLLAGNRQATAGGRFDDTFGLRSELRVGRRDDTRLVAGYSYTDGLGNEAWINLAVHEIDDIPMRGEVVVTNLPVGEDLGVMLNYAVGYQFADWFSLLARVGWNARTITYQGPSAGLSTSLNW